MRIVVTANSSWYAYNFRRSTIQAFSYSGYCIVVAPDDKYAEKLKSLGCEFVQIGMDANGVNPIKEMWTIWHYVKILKSLEPDLVFSFTPKANLYCGSACRYLGLKFSPNVSGLGDGMRGIISFVQKCLYKLTLPSAHHIFFQNNSDVGFIKALLGRKMPAFSIIPGSGVDLSMFKFSKKQFGGRIEFLFLGRLLYSKGVKKYLNVARKLKEKYGDSIRFSLLGFPVENSDKGITPSELVDVSFYGVEYLGDTDDVSHFLSFAHCVVLPTLYGEGVPKSLIEGAASGCALISSDGAGCSRIVKNGINGLLVNPNFEDEILLAIEKYYLLPQTEKEQLSINSRKIVEEEFDERIVIDAYKIVAE